MFSTSDLSDGVKLQELESEFPAGKAISLWLEWTALPFLELGLEASAFFVDGSADPLIGRLPSAAPYPDGQAIRVSMAQPPTDCRIA